MADTKEVEQGDAQHPSLVELISSAKPKKCPQAAEPTQVDEIKEAKNKEQKPRTQGHRTRSRSRKTAEDRQKEREQFAEHTDREIFVGGVPVTTTEKDLRALFRPFGKVECCRFRSLPVQKKMPQRAAAMKRVIVENRATCNAYVRFATKAEAEAIVKAFVEDPANFVLGGVRVRVSPAGEKTINYKLCVFVGNLPVAAEEDAVRQHFEACGDVVSVRLIRNRTDHMCRGFGYIQFKDDIGVKAALGLHGSSFQDRELRVFRCMHPKKAEKLLIEKQSRAAAAATAPAAPSPPILEAAPADRAVRGSIIAKRPKAQRPLRATSVKVVGPPLEAGRKRARDTQDEAAKKAGEKRARSASPTAVDAKRPRKLKHTARKAAQAALAGARAPSSAPAPATLRSSKLAGGVHKHTQLAGTDTDASPAPQSEVNKSELATKPSKKPRKAIVTAALPRAEAAKVHPPVTFGAFFEGLHAQRGDMPNLGDTTTKKKRREGGVRARAKGKPKK